MYIRVHSLFGLFHYYGNANIMLVYVNPRCCIYTEHTKPWTVGLPASLPYMYILLAVIRVQAHYLTSF